MSERVRRVQGPRSSGATGPHAGRDPREPLTAREAVAEALEDMGYVWDGAVWSRDETRDFDPVGRLRRAVASLDMPGEVACAVEALLRAVAADFPCECGAGRFAPCRWHNPVTPGWRTAYAALALACAVEDRPAGCPECRAAGDFCERCYG